MLKNNDDAIKMKKMSWLSYFNVGFLLIQAIVFVTLQYAGTHNQIQNAETEKQIDLIKEHMMVIDKNIEDLKVDKEHEDDQQNKEIIRNEDKWDSRFTRLENKVDLLIQYIHSPSQSY